MILDPLLIFGMFGILEMGIALKPSRHGVIITIAREHGSSGKQIGKIVAQSRIIHKIADNGSCVDEAQTERVT